MIHDPEYYRLKPGYCELVTRWLQVSGVEHIARDYWRFQNVVWEIVDNGGELCIGRVNIDEGRRRKVAYSGFKPTPSPCTLFHRIWQVLNDKPVNYDFRAEEPGEPWLEPYR